MTSLNNQTSANGPPLILNDRTEILNHCLQAIETGEASIESCVQQFPQFSELGSLLQAARTVQILPQVTLATPARDAIRQRMMQSYRQQQRVSPPKARVVLRQTPAWLRLAAVIIFGIFAVFFAGGGVVQASSGALPGDPLYGVKRIAENVRLELTNTFAGAADRVSLLDALAQTRLAELQALTIRNHSIPDSVLSDVAASVRTAVAAQTEPSKRNDLLLHASTVLQQAKTTRVLTASGDVIATEVILSLQSEITGGQQVQQPPTPTATSPATIPAAVPATESATKPATEPPTEPAVVATATWTPEPSRSPVPSDTPVPTATVMLVVPSTTEPTQAATSKASGPATKTTAAPTTTGTKQPTSRATKTSVPPTVQPNSSQGGGLGQTISATANGGQGIGQGQGGGKDNNPGVGQGQGGGQDNNPGLGQGGQDNNKGKN